MNRVINNNRDKSEVGDLSMRDQNFKRKTTLDITKIPQFIRYLIAGGMTYISEIILTYLLIEILQMSVFFGGITAWLFALFFSYILNVKIVFLGYENGKKEFTAFFLSTALIGFTLNSLLFPFLVNNLDWDIILAKTVVIALITILNYIVRNFYIFNKK